MEAWPWVRRSARPAVGSLRGAVRSARAWQGSVSVPEILLLVLSATIAGADDFVETTLWGTEHLAFLKRFYGYANVTPGHLHCDLPRIARFRTGDGPQNMAIIRHTTLNLLSRAKPTPA
jgi:hypothetical protein